MEKDFLFLNFFYFGSRFKKRYNQSQWFSLLGDSIVVLMMKFNSHKEPDISTVGRLGTKVVYMKYEDEVLG